jgi:hypothetical protein
VLCVVVKGAHKFTPVLNGERTTLTKQRNH